MIRRFLHGLENDRILGPQTPVLINSPCPGGYSRMKIKMSGRRYASAIAALVLFNIWRFTHICS